MRGFNRQIAGILAPVLFVTLCLQYGTIRTFLVGLGVVDNSPVLVVLSSIIVLGPPLLLIWLLLRR